MESNHVSAEWNIYDWILSEEIREDWRRHPPLPLSEEARIISFAYRSIEEKLQALAILSRRAKDTEEKEELEQAVNYYKAAVSHMKSENEAPKKPHPGEIWTIETFCYDSNMGSIGDVHELEEFHLEYSYEMAKKWIWGLRRESAGEVYSLNKWILEKEKPKRVLECSLRYVGDELCTTHVYLDEYKTPFLLHDRRLPLGLPFSTGQLVKLEGPVFLEPLFGVWCGEYGFDGCWYNYMGYMEGREDGKTPVFTVRNMGYHGAELHEEFGILDWLHSASGEELPEEQKALGEIAGEISDIRKERGDEAAAGRFREIFIP